MRDLKEKSRKPTLLLVAYVAGIVLIFLYSLVIFNYVKMKIDDSARINVSGRLRMLSQKISKELLLYRSGKDTRASVRKSVNIFHSTLHSLQFGGRTHQDLESRRIVDMAPIHDSDSLMMVRKIAQEWEPFRKETVIFLEKKNGESLEYVLEHNEHLLSTIDAAVVTINRHADRDQRILAAMIASAVIIAVTAVSAAFVRQVRKYRQASKRLAEMELLLPICSSCKKIRMDNTRPEDPRSWISIEKYLSEKKDMTLTHGICPDCARRLYPELFEDESG